MHCTGATPDCFRLAGENPRQSQWETLRRNARDGRPPRPWTPGTLTCGRSSKSRQCRSAPACAGIARSVSVLTRESSLKFLRAADASPVHAHLGHRAVAGDGARRRASHRRGQGHLEIVDVSPGDQRLGPTAKRALACPPGAEHCADQRCDDVGPRQVRGQLGPPRHYQRHRRIEVCTADRSADLDQDAETSNGCLSRAQWFTADPLRLRRLKKRLFNFLLHRRV